MNSAQSQVLKEFQEVAPTLRLGNEEIFLAVAPPDIWGVTVLPLGNGVFAYGWESAFQSGLTQVGRVNDVIVCYINIMLDFDRYVANEIDVDYIQPEVQ